MDKVVPPEIEISLKVFNRQSTILQALYVILGVLAITAPIVVAGLTDLLGTFMTGEPAASHPVLTAVDKAGFS